MIQKDQKLNPRLFELSVEQAAIRQGFGEGLLEAGEADKNVVVVTADLKESTRVEMFAHKFLERTFDVGVAEQNLAGVGSGLAAMGKIPFIASYAIFSPGRNWEQIRTTICYNNQPVKIAGSHAGLSVGPDGGSHQALEDIALTRVLPNMTVVAPCDAVEAYKATLAVAKHPGPCYLRLAREKTPVITTDSSPFEIGKANILFEAEKAKIGIIACGSLVYQALLAARKLSREGIPVVVLNCHTIKPIDRETIILLAARVEAIITVEEHQRAGGLGGAVAEVLAEDYPKKMAIMGVNDAFGQSGEASELIERYGLGADDIIDTAKSLVGKKK